MLRPYLAGNGWRALFTPVKTGCYVNDHCVIQDHAGRWHVFGITKAARARQRPPVRKVRSTGLFLAAQGCTAIVPE